MKLFWPVLSSVTLGLSASASASPIQQGEVPTARVLVDHWRRAVRARSFSPGEIAVTIRTGDEDGLTGSLQERVTLSGDYAWKDDRHFDHDEGVLVSSGAVERDWNGFIRRPDGTELQRLRTSAAVARALAFGPQPGVVGAVEDAGESWTFRVIPKGGEEIRWSIDKKNWLPVRSVMRGSVRDQTTAYSDWEPSAGVLIPRRVVLTDTVHAASIYTLASPPAYRTAAAADFQEPRAGPSDVTMASDVVTVPITMAANHVIVQVSVNGRSPIGFLLDTGAEHETLNTPRLGAMGLTTYGSSKEQGGGGTTDSSHAQHLSMSVGGASVHDQHADVLDETGLERLWGVPLGGILGYDFISRFVVELDFGAKVMRLYRPGHWAYRGSGVVLPLTFDEGIPYLDASISVPTKPSLPAHLLVDFGAAGVLTFSSPFVRSNDLVRLIAPNATVSTTPGGQQFYTQNNIAARIDALKLGDLELKALPVSLSTNTDGAYASSNLAATMGNGIYSRFRVFVDYAHERLILEPTADSFKPYSQAPSFGLTLLSSGDDLRTFTVAGVRGGSSAEAAGFKKGDIIESVDGLNASQMTLEDLRNLVADDAERRSFGLRRGSDKLMLQPQHHERSGGGQSRE